MRTAPRRAEKPVLNALTVDMEDWFCVSNFDRVIDREDWPKLESRVEASTRNLLDLFERHGVKATFFVLGWIAERHSQLIREIADQGHELASHGYEHRLASELSAEEFREDLARSLCALKSASGEECRGYRAPSFSIRRDMHWVWESLADQGIRYDSSIFPVVHDRYGEPEAPRFPFTLRSGRAQIIEVPLSTVRLFARNIPVAGGGYLRLYPLVLTRWAIRRLNRHGHPAVIYLHPWEVDPDQPRPPISRLTLFRHHVGISSVMRKMNALLSEFEFGPLTRVIETVQIVDV